MGKTWGFPD